jgi:hypothetical protein
MTSLQEAGMFGRLVVLYNLTFAELRRLGILSFACCIIFASHLSQADPAPAAQTLEVKQRISEVETYIRQQTLQGANLLPSSLKSGLVWVSGKWHTVTVSTDDTRDETANEMVSSSDNSSVPLNVASNFHHKGFLPTHDTMTLGIGLGKNFLNDKMLFEIRPFYGQGWTALKGYWGGELSMNIARRPDGMPFGSLALDYVDGNSAMTDHGRGTDLHGDIDLTHNFKFTSGVKQDDVTGNSNYVLIKWDIHFK